MVVSSSRLTIYFLNFKKFIIESFFPSCKMAGEKTEKLDTKEKKPEAKKADAGGRLRRVTSRPRRLRRGSPTAAEALS